MDASAAGVLEEVLMTHPQSEELKYNMLFVIQNANVNHGT